MSEEVNILCRCHDNLIPNNMDFVMNSKTNGSQAF